MKPIITTYSYACIKRALAKRTAAILSLLCVQAVIVSCAVNPVTGKNEVSLVSGQQELAMGKQHYGPTIQAQGGEFLHDAALNRYINEVGQKLAAQSDRKLPYEFKVINSSEPNAWALPGGKLAINRGMLLQMKSEAELAAVLSHEIVHAAARHTAKQQTTGTFLNLGMQILDAKLAGSSNAALAMQGANIGAHLINSRYSQSAELEADAYGMKYMSRAGYDPQGAVDLQETFLRLSQSRGSSALSTLFSTHPPSAQRVAANKRHMAGLPQGGVRGEARYQQAISRIKRLQPAYDLYDKGTKAAAKKQNQQALDYANQAIRKFSNEGQFYELRGYAQAQLKQNQSALNSYKRAIQLNPNHFSPYLRRGLLLMNLGQNRAAEQDLMASYRLLPHPVTQKALGQLRGAPAQQRIR